MFNFLLGVLVTLAILYPTATKNLFSKAVDSINTVVTSTVNEESK